MDKKDSWMKWAAIAALIAGGSTGLISLIAPLGVWVGLWQFGTGFSILGFVYPLAGWVGLACMMDALILAGLASLKGKGNAVTLFNLAAAGALAAGLAWYIPSSFRAPEGQSYPPIHDVSTDLVDIPEYIAIMPLRIDAPNTTEYGGSRNMTPERNAQLQQEAFPDLVSHYYEDSRADIFARALNAVDTMGWELVAAVPAEGRIEATATTFWFRFKDDVVIRLREEGGKTRVDARSLSRVGGGDAGTNGKRLQAFFRLMDQE